MTKRMIKKIISIIVTIAALVSGISFWVQHYQSLEEYKAFYEKIHLTASDLNTESSYKYSTTITPDEEGKAPPEEVRYKKLYGIEYIGKYDVDEDGGIEVKFLHGDPAKILILDKKGNERFYAEVSEAEFEPGEAGEYDVYLIGNKFTGRIAFSTY